MNKEFKCGKRFACSARRIFTGEQVLEDHAVLVGNGVVSGVVPLSSLPKDIPLYYEPDCTILPGLIDSHIHFMRWQAPLFLAYGVTTVRDIGNDLNWILKQRKEWEKNQSPRILRLCRN